jgi:hypothetical protein
MKHFSLLFINLFLLITSVNLQAQDFGIPNGGFENWSVTDSWSEPNGYNTGNSLCVALGLQGNTSKTDNAHGGLFAAELTTEGDAMNGLFPAAIAVGPLGYQDMPNYDFQDRPDSIEFYALHNIADGDVAVILFEFYLLGSTIGTAYMQITGVTDDYVRYVMPVIYENDEQPDQMGMVAANSNWNNPNPESILTLDDIHFIYNEGSGEDMPNGDFENWTDYSLSGPDGWSTSNYLSLPQQSVTEDEDAYEGAYSCRIESVYSNLAEGNLGFIYLGDVMNEECSDMDAQYPDLNTVPIAINFHYKYECDSPEDSASFYFFAKRINSKGGDCDSTFEDVMYLPVVSEWTAVTYQIPSDVYTEWFNLFINGIDAVTNLTVAFVPGEIPIGPEDEVESTEGAVLWIDNLSVMNDFFVSVEEQGNNSIHVYPNPTKDLLTVELPTGQFSAMAELRDVTGKLILSEQCRGPRCQLNTAALPEGTYVLNVYNDQFHSNKSVVIVR